MSSSPLYGTGGVAYHAEIEVYGARTTCPGAMMIFLTVDTRTPYVADYPGEDGGKTAHCMLR